jgi:transposase-like protein
MDLKHITKVASKYNVSDNSIRKWIDKYKKLI